ncbi:carboxypeptidase-like regulatory domain-containing protein, partial [Salmonella sp. SAL4356]|uniref:carboxypeptidase-like regulatory domain-containing protein n=1 Tax=Salmonella sp. SAL4356 TaxID=3159877 RepID=UPI00397AC362
LRLDRCAISFVVLAIAAGPDLSTAGAQGTSGTSAGTVVEPKGAVVPGATVTVRSGTSEARTAVTDAAGGYTLPDLPAGVYGVEVQL